MVLLLELFRLKAGVPPKMHTNPFVTKSNNHTNQYYLNIQTKEIFRKPLKYLNFEALAKLVVHYQIPH